MNLFNGSASRRQWFRRTGSGLLAGLWPRGGFAASAAARADGSVYDRIGVRPIVNCKGTFTIISGSQSLPEVKRAMDEASRHYVHLDELMDGVGRRLAELTKAEWGIITAGCAAALTHSTAACIAGADPEKMQRLPQLAGLKDEVVMPRQSRNVYDHAIRMLGVKMVSPESRQEFLDALRPRTAMVALLGEALSEHPMPIEEMCEAAHKKGIPVIVDAAAERLTVPNVYLAKGADMVAYSGGKCFRGPQCSGVLLGKKSLLQAAWINSAPHHAFGRSLKVGKEEIMGMLAAVEAWTRRDHEAEWKEWESWLGVIRDKIGGIETVQTEVSLPTGPSNYAPQLNISWDAAKLGLTPDEVSDMLLAGTPRVLIPAYRRGLSIMPYMMMPGDAQVAGAKLAEALKSGPRPKPESAAPAVTVSGQWDVELNFVRGSAHHTLFLEQDGAKLRGQHRGEFLAGDLRGMVEGSSVKFGGSHRYEGTGIGYRFDGKMDGGVMRGTVDLGEYGKADFVARRHFNG